ncbi:MAG: Kelch repeat-containing protein, partial [Thermomicrobiales bacterium]
EAGKTADLWTGSFDASGFAWSSLAADGATPAARSSHDSVVLNQTMYVFGGSTDSGAINDLWALDLPQ